jgi:hypothetical protein
MPAGGAPASGNASSHARIVPLLLRLVPRLQSAFPGVPIQLRGDAGFALPLLYEFCEFFGIEYALGIPANCVFKRRAEPQQRRLKRRYRRTQLPQRSFSSFRHRARSWSHQRRICYKAEHTAAGTNLRFVVTHCAGRAAEVFAFYNDRGECENRIEEFKNGFRADRLSCHRFWPTPSACSSRSRLPLGQLVPSAVAATLALGPDRNPPRPTLQTRRRRMSDRPLQVATPNWP